MSREVHGLWIGPKLSLVEQVSIQSFLDNGHVYNLFTYGPLEGAPNGAVMHDANEILPAEKIYRAPDGGLASFSDYFRWKLLHERGGIWADLDVICLKPFNFGDGPLFGLEDDQGTIGTAVLGFAPRDPITGIMLRACEDVNALQPFDTPKAIVKKLARRAIYGTERSRAKCRFTEPGGPAYFTRFLRYYGCEGAALPTSAFYPLPYWEWRDIFKPAPDVAERLAGSSAIHVWNKILSSDQSVDTQKGAIRGTMLGVLAARHGLA